MTAQEQTAVLAVSLKAAIGRRPRSLVTSRGSSTSAMAASTTTLSAPVDGFGLFGVLI